MSAAAADLLRMVRTGQHAGNVRTEAKRQFRFFLCGDPALVADFRGLLLRGHGDAGIPMEAASTLETIDPARRPTVSGPDVKAVVFLGRPGDVAGARLDLLADLKIPVYAVTVDPATAPGPQPIAAPLPGEVGDYAVPRLDAPSLRGRVFPHIVDRCKGVEVAVGRCLPVMRETVAAKLTRDAASSALKISTASAVVDHVPLLGVLLGPVTSAGDMVAITGIQIVLVMQIGATYGHDPDPQRIWELLPVVGGGLGWRALSRELAGFVPVAGIAIKGAIAYAGTIVIGEGAGFYYEHGRHMTKAQAATLYDEKKRAALTFARDFVAKLRKK